MNPTAAQGLRFHSLDAMRGIFATCVVFYHLHGMKNAIAEKTGQYTSNLFFEWSLFKHSYAFVDFFFVLSGFVIAHSYMNKVKDGASLSLYMKKRFLRIYPLHAFVILGLFLPFELLKTVADSYGVVEKAAFQDNSLFDLLSTHQ